MRELRLAVGRAGKLAGYRWSSLVSYAKGKGPPWLEMERVLVSFELAEDGRGWRAYVAWLEARAANDGGAIDEVAQAALRRRRTAVSAEWIATRLRMGHPGSVSRQVGIVKRDRKLLKQANDLDEMLQ